MESPAEEELSPLEEMRTKLKALEFDEDDHTKFITTSCLRYQAKILEGCHCGYESLAIRIIESDRELGRTWSWRYSPFVSSKHADAMDQAFVEVIEALLTIPNVQDFSMLQMMLKGDLGHYLFQRGQIPQKLPDEDNPTRFRPVIYVLLHCNEVGIAPTKAQYLHILDRMKYYLDNSSSRGHEDRDVYARKVNFASCNTVPGLPRDRDWGYYINDSGHNKWKAAAHPRRYSYSPAKVRSIKEFIAAFEKRLRKIPAENIDNPIPWHLIYVGWTCKYEGRQPEHYQHAIGQDIKNLLETIAFLEYPHKKYFMHMYPVINVSSPSMVRTEHVVSLLTGSYACYGGLNGTSGGKVSDMSNAESLDNTCWDAGKRALVREGIMEANLSEYQRQMKWDNRILKMEKTWKMVEKLEAEKVIRNERLQAVKAQSVEANREYINSMYENVVDKMGKWAIIDDGFDRVWQVIKTLRRLRSHLAVSSSRE